MLPDRQAKADNEHDKPDFHIGGLAGSIGRIRRTRVLCDPEHPGRAPHQFTMLSDEDPETLLDEGNVRRLLASRSEEDAHPAISRKVIYQFHARMTDRWRDGRIFLTGDAVHLTPPFAGQGLNSGVRDAANLE